MSRIPEDEAEAHVHGICLKTGPPGRVGVELEWLVRDARDPALPVPAERIAAAVTGFAAAPPDPAPGDHHPGQPPPLVRQSKSHPAAALPVQSSPVVFPSGGLLTTEPGGQLELSSAPAATLAECVTATAGDLAALRESIAGAGLELAGYGLDPLRPPQRVLDLPRYAAMEEYFDRGGQWGRQMMCGTASVQVCLDAGDDGAGQSGYRWRWRLLHAIGPVLVAAFANSPLRGGRPTGWRSARQQVWANLDPGRTRPPAMSEDVEADSDPRAAWTAYALDAEVMCVRDPGSGDWSAPPGLTFRGWLRGDQPELRPPTSEDLTYHLSTLFPPVRPRGHLELRMIDAQPGDGWIVPAAVVTALVDDAQAAGAAMAAAEPLRRSNGEDPWLRAARCGPADPRLGRASRECFEAADAALGRMGAPAQVRRAVADFTEDYVLKDRCPADDQLEEVT
jgi:ergothioneine biosynthesis glutamate--cysteine ligase EgtA